jgi:hypothetical protein
MSAQACTSCSYCSPVSDRLAVAAGDGARRFAVVGVTVQIRGGSAIFDPLTAGFAGSAVLAHALVGRRGTRSVRASRRAVSPGVALLLALVGVEIYSK